MIDSAARSEIEAFLDDVKHAGALIYYRDERDEAQRLLEFWTNQLIGAGHDVFGRFVDSFVPSNGPVLPDNLCPYPGIHAFGEPDATHFFGQQKLLGDVITYLRQPQNRLLVLVGPPASGKTSLLFGGVLPRLKQEPEDGSAGWGEYLETVPGSNPLANLGRLIQQLGMQPGGRAANNPNIQPALGAGVAASQPIATIVGQLRENRRYLAQAINHRFERPVLLVVDRFEELFTLCRDDAIRKAFVDNLLSLIESQERHTLVISVRSNFDPRNRFASELKALVAQVQPLFEQSEVQIPLFTAIQLREAIVEPAKRIGLIVYDEVVDSLIQDVLNEPIPLPLLQFTLVRLWNKRERNILAPVPGKATAEPASDLALGRQPALVRSATRFYDRLSDAQRQVVQELLLSMVDVDDEMMAAIGVRVRRNDLFAVAAQQHVQTVAQFLSELLAQPAGRHRPLQHRHTTAAYVHIDALLDQMAEAGIVRLIPGQLPEDDQVEITHEVLIRSWDVFRTWLDDKRQSIVWRRRLRADAQYWAKDRSAIWTELRLEESRQHDYRSLTEHERKFLLTSAITHLERKQAEERQRASEIEQVRTLAKAERRHAEAERRRAEAERLRADDRARTARRLRWLAISLAIVATLAIIAAGIAYDAQQNAVAAELKAVAEKRTAEAARRSAEAAQQTTVALQQTVSAGQQDVYRLKTSVATASALAQAASQELATKAAQLQSLPTGAAEYNALETQVADIRATGQSAEDHLATSIAFQNAAQSNVNAAEGRIAELQGVNTLSQTQISSERARADNAQAQASTAAVNLASAQTGAANVSADLMTANTQISTLQGDVAKAQATASSALTMVATLEAEITSMKTAIAAITPAPAPGPTVPQRPVIPDATASVPTAVPATSATENNGGAALPATDGGTGNNATPSSNIGSAIPTQ